MYEQYILHWLIPIARQQWHAWAKEKGKPDTAGWVPQETNSEMEFSV